MRKNTSTTHKPSSVTLFASCMVDQFAPHIGEHTVDVLEHLGVTVEFASEQTCCGQPAFNSGFRSEAYPVGEKFVEIFERVNGLIVVPSGSCAAMVRNYYKDLFRDNEDLVRRAEQVAGRLFELTEFLYKFFGPSAVKGSSNKTVTYHKCCHLLREIGIDEEPVELLSGLEGIQIVPLERADVCCGFGGAFSVKMPDISSAILDEKLDYIQSTGADYVVAGDAGCIFQMQGGLRRRNSNIRVVHIAEALTDSIERSKRSRNKQ